MNVPRHVAIIMDGNGRWARQRSLPRFEGHRRGEQSVREVVGRRLDRLSADMRAKRGKVLNRAEIIRALIDGLIDSGLDITNTGSEADLRARVSRRLGSS